MVFPQRPIGDSYWVEPRRLLAGEYPRNKDDASSRAKLRSLLEAGMTFFLVKYKAQDRAVWFDFSGGA